MDWKVLALVAGGIALIVLGAFAVFSGFAFNLLVFFFNNPLLLIAFLVLLLSFLAWRSGHGAIALSLLGIFLISFGLDFFYPPVSRVCTEPNPSVALSFIEQYPEASFASDSAVCKFLIQTIGSFLVYRMDLVPPQPIFFLLVPFMVLGILLMVSLAHFLNPTFWLGAFILFGFLIVSLILFNHNTVSEINITLAGLLAYGLIAPLLVAVGTFLSTRSLS